MDKSIEFLNKSSFHCAELSAEVLMHGINPVFLEKAEFEQGDKSKLERFFVFSDSQVSDARNESKCSFFAIDTSSTGEIH